MMNGISNMAMISEISVHQQPFIENSCQPLFQKYIFSSFVSIQESFKILNCNTHRMSCPSISDKWGPWFSDPDHWSYGPAADWGYLENNLDSKRHRCHRHHCCLAIDWNILASNSCPLNCGNFTAFPTPFAQWKPVAGDPMQFLRYIDHNKVKNTKSLRSRNESLKQIGL